MITDKQRQKDFEYEADYQSKCPYTVQQWVNLIKAGQFDEQELTLLKEVYASYNHVANLIQLSYRMDLEAEEVRDLADGMGKTLLKANDLGPETDFDGKEYWWYPCFWGKNLTQARTLELKLQPDLSEAVGQVWPEMEQAYYAFAGDVDRSLQYRFTEEDSVWIAAAVLLYEKYFCNPRISVDDILLMQYEVQTRAQKIFGQDVESSTISVVCNADERGHRLNYLRDIYKYYRVSFPGEFEDDRERPDPEKLDYNLYVYSLFGYMTIHQTYDFISHEYAHLVDESYVEINQANGYVRLAAFLTRKGGTACSPQDNSDKSLDLRAEGEDAETTFHQIAEGLFQDYPNFSYAGKASWYLEGENRIPYEFCDRLYIEDYAWTRACLSVRTLPDQDSVHIETALNLPWCNDEDAMLAIQDKCHKLTLMTTAAFQVETGDAQNWDLDPDSRKVKAFSLFPYEEMLSMKEEDITAMILSPLEILASYYTDICRNYYPQTGSGEGETDPLAAALGSKLIYKQAADTPGPQIIYKEGTASSTTDFVTRAIQGQGYGKSVYAGEEASASGPAEGAEAGEWEGDRPPVPTATATATATAAAATTQAATGPMSGSNGGRDSESPDKENYDSIAVDSRNQTSRGEDSRNQNERDQSGNPGNGRGQTGHSGNGRDQIGNPGDGRSRFAGDGGPGQVSSHPDRQDQTFRLYPKNTLIKGPLKTAKYHKAILTAVGIIEGKEYDMVSIEPIPEVLAHYMEYVEEGRILQVSCPDCRSKGYEGWIESVHDGRIRDGIFKSFANRCAGGRYVVMMEDVDLDWRHLFGETTVLLRENRREGTSSETTITLSGSGDPFKLPSNLYLVSTCDSTASEDTVIGAISQDFFIRHVNPEPEVLANIRIRGITLERLMNTLNLRISYFLGEEYQLGEGFFLASPEQDEMVSLGRVFREQIIPLLEKWFDGDIERIRYVLGDNGKSRPEIMFYQQTPFREELFKGHLPDDFDRERIIYRLNERAFFLPESYIGVYQ